jgi:hypothetical protein
MRSNSPALPVGVALWWMTMYRHCRSGPPGRHSEVFHVGMRAGARGSSSVLEEGIGRTGISATAPPTRGPKYGAGGFFTMHTWFWHPHAATIAPSAAIAASNVRIKPLA